MEHVIGTIRKFERKNFTVVVDAIEDTDIDLSWDEDGATREGLESGEFMAFCARARVFYKGTEIASEYLGSCIYKSLADFADHIECGRANRKLARAGSSARCGSYFADMIATVCKEARAAMADFKTANVRTA